METARDTPLQRHEELRQEADDAYRRDDYPEAIRLYTAALACLERTDPKNRESKGRILSWLALSYQYAKDFASARRFHETELRVARQLRNQDAIVDALHRLGDAYIELKEDRRAERCLSESLKLARKRKPYGRDIPHLLFDLARIAERRKQWSVATRHYRAWIEVQQSRHDEELPRGWYRLGWVAEEQRNWQAAEEHYYTTLVVAQESGNAIWEGYGFLGLGRIATELERYDRADDFFRQALEFGESFKRISLTSSVYLSWGNLAYRRGRFADACPRYREGIHWDNEGQAWSGCITGFQNMGAAQFCMGTARSCQKLFGLSALSFAMANTIKEKYKEAAPSRFADYYRAKCKKAASEAVWQEAQERAQGMSIPEALAYFSDEQGAKTDKTDKMPAN